MEINVRTVVSILTLKAKPQEGGLAQLRDQAREGSPRTVNPQQPSALSLEIVGPRLLARENSGIICDFCISTRAYDQAFAG